MSSRLPPSLPGSRIVVTEDHDGTRLIWLPDPSRPWALIVFTNLLLCGWLYGEWFVIRQLADRGFAKGASTVFAFAWLFLWTLTGVFMVIMFVRMLRPPLPEWIQLGDKWFTHNEGRPPMTLERLQSITTWWPTRARRSRTGKRHEALQFQLDSADNRQRLMYELDKERYEVGQRLSTPEREWLADELVRWNKQTP